MNGYQYEEKCAELLRGRGFINVDVTPGSGDQGVDIIAEKDGIKWAVQCKYYEGTVGNKAVQEVFAGACFYDCDKALIITNSKLTNPAQILADKLKVEVWDDINAIVLQQEASSLNADRVYVDDEQAMSAIEAYLKGEAYEQFLREYPPNDALNQEIEAFVNDISARIEKMHNELVQSANDPSKAEIIEAYFENRNDFIDLSKKLSKEAGYVSVLENYRYWHITEELRKNLNNILLYPFDIDILAGFTQYINYCNSTKKQGDSTKLINDNIEKYHQQLHMIVDKELVAKCKAELVSIEVLIFQYIERGENDGASYMAMNSLVVLLEQLYCCGVVPVTTTSVISHIYFFNFQPYFDGILKPFWKKSNQKYNFFRVDRPIDLACQGKILEAKSSRDNVPIEPIIQAEIDEQIRLMLLKDKYNENEKILAACQGKIDFYRGEGLKLIDNYKQDLTLAEIELQNKMEVYKEITQAVSDKTQEVEQLRDKVYEAERHRNDLRKKQSNKIIRSYVLNQKISDAINSLEQLRTKYYGEKKILQQQEEEKRGIEKNINQYNDKVRKIKRNIENLEIDLLTSEYKVSLNQAEYDKQKKVLDEIQEAINNNHRDFLFENYGDIIYGMRK